MKKWYALWIIVAFIVLFIIFSYTKVEILSIDAEEKLESFDISCFDNVYGKGTPKVYDRKIYAYRKGEYAKVLYVLGDCEFGVMIELMWNDERDCWEKYDGRVMWTIHGGSAQEFYWPLYYADKVYPLLDD